MKSVDLFSDSGLQEGLQSNTGCMTVSLGHSYLGAWFETLKQSAHYTQMEPVLNFVCEA
jgi:hypothetical protein